MNGTEVGSSGVEVVQGQVTSMVIVLIIGVSVVGSCDIVHVVCHLFHSLALTTLIK